MSVVTTSVAESVSMTFSGGVTQLTDTGTSLHGEGKAVPDATLSPPESIKMSSGLSHF